MLNPTKNNLTLQKACSILKIKEHEFVQLIPTGKLMKMQLKHLDRGLLKRKEKLEEENSNLTIKEQDFAIKVFQRRVEFKSLTVKERDLDKQLGAVSKDVSMAKKETAGLIFDILTVTEENTDAERMINHYLKEKFPAVLKALHIEAPPIPKEPVLQVVDKPGLVDAQGNSL